MTEGVTSSAAVPGAVHRPSGGLHGRREANAAGAFDQALGVPKAQDRAEAGTKAKADAWRQAGNRPGAGNAALDAQIAKGGHAGKAMIDAKPTRGLAGSPDQPGDTATDKTEPAETGAEGGLPTQMRAEQAISAIMTITPIMRQSAPPTGHDAAPNDGEAVADADAETAASGASKAAPAGGAKLVQEQPSQARQQVSAEHVAAKRDTRTQMATTGAPIQTAAASGHETKAPRGATAEGTKQAGAQAGPGELADTVTEKTAFAVPGQARSGGSNDGADAKQSGPDGGDAAREIRRGEQISAAGRVAVMADQAAPAPVAPPLSANSAAIINAIGAGPDWRAASNLSSALPGDAQNTTQPMRELKIQLHPLELGVVTAHLRTVGEKLSVELKVDNHDAYHRLSADSDAIVKSLRSLGFEIDSVSIQQPQAAATTVARSDAGTGTSSSSRDAPSFEPGNSGSGGERLGGQARGRGERGGGQGNDAVQLVYQDRAGSSLYI